MKGMRQSCATVGFALAVVVPVRAQSQEEVIVSTVDGGRLAGTLLIPDGPGPHPAALIIPASGPHPRDEGRTGGTHWADLAERLAAIGMATLRLDNRGVAGSSSEVHQTWEYVWSPEELASDAEAALSLLGEAKEVDAGRVGLIALSDGVVRAAMVGARRPEDVAFCVLLSATGVSTGENLRAQQVGQARMMGLDKAGQERIDDLAEAAINAIIEGADTDTSEHAVMLLLEAMGLPEEQVETAANGAVQALTMRGTRTMLAHDPSHDLRQLRCPTLIVNGGDDSRLVSPRSTPALLEALDAESRSSSVRFKPIDGLDHFLESGEKADPPTFDDQALDVILDWLESIDLLRRS